MSNENQNTNKDEIDLIHLVKVLWTNRKTAIKINLIFVLFGLFIAIFSQTEYTASTSMIPQSSSGKSSFGGNLSGLAGMVGINLDEIGSGSSGISPNLYPKIISSIPFQKDLLKTPLSIKDRDDQPTFTQYYKEIYKPGLLSYIKKYTIGLPGLALKAFRGQPKQDFVYEDENAEIFHISRQERDLMERLGNQLTLTYDDKTSFISLSAQMPEAKAAAQLVRKAQVLLQKTITDFKVKKAKNKFDFVQERYEEKRKEAEQAQQNLARFRDQNKNMSTATAQTELDRLSAEYSLIYGVYAELAKQLETQKIQVKEDTPLFTVIDPVSVPTERSKPNRMLIVMIWTFLGAILGIGFVFGKEFWSKIKAEWNAKSD